mgnify:CR=1 FL=1
MVKNWLMQFIVYVGIMIFGFGMAWAAYGARITELERSTAIYSTDHDTLISLNTKMDMLIKSVCEIQKDLKESLKK